MTTPDISQLFGVNGNPGQILTLGYGKANFANTLSTYAAMRVLPPFQRVTAINSGKRHGRLNTQQVGQYELNGVVINGHIEHPQGTVILLQASWKRSGAPIRDAALFMRLRHGAPLYQVDAFIPTTAQNIFGDRFTVFQGYADLLTPDELTLLGIKANNSYLQRFMDLEEVAECYAVRELHPESIPRPRLSAVATPTGMEFRELPQEPARRIILRRR